MSPEYSDEWYIQGSGYGYGLVTEGENVVVHLINEDGESILLTGTYAVSDPNLYLHLSGLRSLIQRGLGHRVQRFYEDQRSD